MISKTVGIMLRKFSFLASQLLMRPVLYFNTGFSYCKKYIFSCNWLEIVYTTITPVEWNRMWRFYFLLYMLMLTAKQSSDMLKNMSPQQRLEALKNKVSAKTREALEVKIRETVAAYERDIEIVLTSKICTDPDKDIAALLKGLGYTSVKITSDFPGYSESYEGTTKIKFSIPEFCDPD